jgi:hypothetical protein
MHSSRGHGSAIAREHSLQSLTPEEQSASATACGAEAAGEDVVANGGGRAVAAVGGGLGGREERRDDGREWIEVGRHYQLSRRDFAALPEVSAFSRSPDVALSGSAIGRPYAALVAGRSERRDVRRRAIDGRSVTDAARGLARRLAAVSASAVVAAPPNAPTISSDRVGDKHQMTIGACFAGSERSDGGAYHGPLAAAVAGAFEATARAAPREILAPRTARAIGELTITPRHAGGLVEPLAGSYGRRANVTLETGARRFIAAREQASARIAVRTIEWLTVAVPSTGGLIESVAHRTRAGSTRDPGASRRGTAREGLSALAVGAGLRLAVRARLARGLVQEATSHRRRTRYREAGWRHLALAIAARERGQDVACRAALRGAPRRRGASAFVQTCTGRGRCAGGASV